MRSIRYGIIAATENEINPFLHMLADVETEERAMLHFHRGRYKGASVVALYCGVCKVNAAIAAQILISVYAVTHIIMIGVAGAINETLNILDTVVASETAYHDVAAGILTEYHPWMKTGYFISDARMLRAILKANETDNTIYAGRIATGEAFIDQEGREGIIRNCAPLCVDMETASVAHVCHVNKIPFVAIRSMSDTPHESGNDAFARYCTAAAEKSVDVLVKALDWMAAHNHPVCGEGAG